MSGPQVYFTWPMGDTLPRLPNSLPRSIPPPERERSFRSPFGIDKELYNFALHWQIPFGFAFAYVFIALTLNGYNRSRWQTNPKTGKKDVPKPWWIARQRPFQWFVVIHNVLLALYSLATFLAMFRAINHTWPGIDNEHGVAGIVDSLCKVHGPRGMGDAATYNTTINIWEVKNTLIHLGTNGMPDSSDYGRLWNEGLAFWGWIFYMSKFYEVIDTLIILAKGKRSPTLQTYHHAGAMLCMWAGIRYMSPPIWMFVFINSGIHAMMYTYYTLSALNIRVPKSIKRTLTTLQITQFLFGATYAAAHLFVQYDIPVTTSYQLASGIQAAASSVSSAAVSATSAVSSFVKSPTATASLGAIIKKLLLRAAGEEGVAERIHNDRGEMITPNLQENIDKFVEQTKQQIFETKWRTDWTRVNCIDTSGEAFAIYLNLFYLTPLTYLFARFFVKAYLSRGKKATVSQEIKATRDDAKKAERQTEAAFEKSGKKIEAHLNKEEVMKDLQRIQDGTYQVAQRGKAAAGKAADRVSETLQKGKDVSDKAGDQVVDAVQKGKDVAEKAGDQVADAVQKGKDVAEKAGDQVADAAQKGKEAAEEISQESPSKSSSQNGVQSTPSTPSKKKKNKKNKSKDKAAQDQGIADSQDVRPGGEDDEKEDDEDDAGETSKQEVSSKEEENAKVHDQSKKGQDAAIAATQDIRPGNTQEETATSGDKKNDDSNDKADSDAMGQSGSLIDLAASVAEREQDERDHAGKSGEEEDPAKGAEQDGAQWKPPGA